MSATVELLDITTIPGAALNIGECRWLPDEAPANLHFSCLLGELCGALEDDTAGGYCVRGNPESWLKLSDVEPAALEAVVRRMEGMRRIYPTWRLHGGGATDVHTAIACHFRTAQARWRRDG